MNKIFRLHTNGSDTVQDWQETSRIQESHIEAISDPSGASVENEITSIPTPFARIDLAKGAFANVVNSKNPEGSSIYHKIVSDCLDVLEIFFNAPLLNESIEVIAWDPGIRIQGGQMSIDPSSDLGQLLSASNPGHKLLGKTLEMYLQQDAAAYNFFDLKNLYLLNYIGGPKEINIIGGTSPATVTFSSANDLSFVDIPLGGRKAFSKSPCGLHLRSRDFIIYVFALRDSTGVFAEKFGDFAAYLRDLVYPIISDDVKSEINRLKADTYNTLYTDISIAGAGAGNHPMVLNFPLKGMAGVALETSDFKLAPTKRQPDEAKVPMVLPAYPFQDPLMYVSAPWNSKTVVPFFDPAPLNERKLPGQNQHKYPYLTVSDFLEDYIIRLPFSTDGNSFFNGHLDDVNGYVLPLKTDLFRYFSVGDVQGLLPGSNVRMFELVKGAAGAIDAILRLPIQKNRFIEMKRTYKVSVTQESPMLPNRIENRGVVAEHAVTVAVYPFLKTGSDDSANYRVLLVDADNDPATKHVQYQLTFFSDDQSFKEVPIESKQRKQDKRSEYLTTDLFALNREFDIIRLSNNIAAGVLIPLLLKVDIGVSEFTFAIDFGTTNTHIEYSVNGGATLPFTMIGRDGQVGLLHIPDANSLQRLSEVRRGLAVMLKVHDQDFLPDSIGATKEAEYKFPQRTVIAESRKLSPGQTPAALGAHNILFTYERRETSKYQDWISNLKWAENDSSGKNTGRITSFIQEVLLLIRNKVLLNNGDVDKTRIVWFYPSSMQKFQRGRLEGIWTQEIGQILSPQVVQTARSIPESLAPFYYFKHGKGMLTGNSNSVNIDIGGGTTDIVLFKGEHPLDSTSFRFAGSAIFGDGFGSNVEENGFIVAFEQAKLVGLLNDGNRPLGAFGDIYHDLKQKMKSDDVISFLFTFKRHKEFAQLGIDFTKFLQEDSRLKIVPLLALSAIIYHTACWLKEQNHECPLNLSFSGSASKFIDILDETATLKIVGPLVNMVFESVYGHSVRVVLKRVENPKEITAKGGLHLNADIPENINRSVSPGLPAASRLSAASLTYKEVVKESTQAAVTDEVRLFLDLFKVWHQALNFKAQFGVDMRNYHEYDALLRQGIRIGLQEGVNRLLKDQGPDEHEDLGETLFFFPFIPLLNQLATVISKPKG